MLCCYAIKAANEKLKHERSQLREREKAARLAAAGSTSESYAQVQRLQARMDAEHEAALSSATALEVHSDSTAQHSIA